MAVMTEVEARKQVCPFIRYCVNEADVVHHGRAPIYVQQLCQASRCGMAWRWYPTREPLSPEARARAGMATGLAEALQPRTYERGYCGACGKPEVTP